MTLLPTYHRFAVIQTLIQRYVRRGEPERLVELGDHLEQTAQGLYGAARRCRLTVF